MGIFSFRQTYVPTFIKYFLVVMVQWNFLYSFISSMPRNCFGSILKFKTFFDKLSLFCVTELEHFSDQYSSIVPTTILERLQLNEIFYTAVSLIPHNVFGFISKFKIFFEILALFRISVVLQRLLPGNVFDISRNSKLISKKLGSFLMFIIFCHYL